MRATELDEQLQLFCTPTGVAALSAWQKQQLLSQLENTLQANDPARDQFADARALMGEPGSSMWLLQLALRDVLRPAVFAPTAAQPLPSLALVRSLFSRLLAAELRPTLHTFNLVLAVFDEHARSSSARNGGSSPAGAASTASEDMEWLRTLWHDAVPLYELHPDALSHVLYLRLSYRCGSFHAICRLLLAHHHAASIVALASPALGGHAFQRPHLILSALTHSSKVDTRIESNQRMEFLGDAVLDIAVRDMVVGRLLALLGVPVRAQDQTSLAQPIHPGVGGGGDAPPIIGPCRSLPDVTSPLLLRHVSLIPPLVFSQLKGKHVSHRMLAPLSRQLGLNHILLEANTEVKSSLQGWVLRTEQKRVATAWHLAQQQGNRMNKGGGQQQFDQQASLRLRTGPLLSSFPTSALSADAAEDAVSDHLAEDVLEACLAALFVDMPLNNSGGNNRATWNGATTTVTANTSSASAAAEEAAAELDDGAVPKPHEMLHTPNIPASSSPSSSPTSWPSSSASAAASFVAQTQAYGFPAVYEFLRSQMGSQLEGDILSAVHRWAPVPPLPSSPLLSHGGGGNNVASVRSSLKQNWALAALRERGEDVHSNAKAELESWVRSRYTDAHGVCQAHVLYVLRGTTGAHMYRVQAVVKILPGGRIPRNRAQGRGFGGGNARGADSLSSGYGSNGGLDHEGFQQRKAEIDAFEHALDMLESSAAAPFSQYVEAFELPRAHGGAVGRGQSQRDPVIARVVADDDYQQLHAQLPYIKFLHDLELAEWQAAQAERGEASSTAVSFTPSFHLLRPDSPISFSIPPALLPPLSSDFDLTSFRLIVAQPTQLAAEQIAAGVALQALGAAGGRGETREKMEKLEGEARERHEMALEAHTAANAKRVNVPSAAAGATAASSNIPFPFHSSSSYSSFLSLLESLLGHRFHSPLLVRFLFFHSPLSSASLSFLGSGLLRFYTSFYAYKTFPHFHEGFLTKIKDVFLIKGNLDHMWQAGPPPPPPPWNGVQEKKGQKEWKQGWEEVMQQVNKEKEGWERREKEKSEEALRAATAAAAAAPFASMLPHLLLLRPPPASSSSSDPFPLASFSDLLEPVLAALYLDGGWSAVDKLAHRLIRPRLALVHRRAREDFPDADLERRDYRWALQHQMQRMFAVTPVVESREVGYGGAGTPGDGGWRARKAKRMGGAPTGTGAGGNGERWEARVVLPIQSKNKAKATNPSTSSPVLPPFPSDPRLALRASLVFDPPPGTYVTLGGDLAFAPATSVLRSSSEQWPFKGVKLLAEQRAARHALQVLHDMQRSGRYALSTIPDQTATAGKTAASSKRWRPEELRDVLHRCAASARRLNGLSAADTSELKQQLSRLVLQLIKPSSRGVAYPSENSSSSLGEFKTAAATNLSPDVSSDPFNSLLDDLSPRSDGASASRSHNVTTTTLAESARWRASDYEILISSLHSVSAWVSLASLWPLLLEIDFVISLQTTRHLVDGFAHSRNLPLIIQCVRRLRGQAQKGGGVSAAAAAEVAAAASSSSSSSSLSSVISPALSLYEHVMLSCIVANPLWSWQQMEKLVAEIIDAQHLTPHVRTFNIALFMAATAMKECEKQQHTNTHRQAQQQQQQQQSQTAAEAAAAAAVPADSSFRPGVPPPAAASSSTKAAKSSQLPPQATPMVLSNPGLVLNSSDALRVRMQTCFDFGAVAISSDADAADAGNDAGGGSGGGGGNKGGPDDLTIALLLLLDAYALRLSNVVRAMDELERRLRLREPDFASTREVNAVREQAQRKEEERLQRMHSHQQQQAWMQQQKEGNGLADRRPISARAVLLKARSPPPAPSVPSKAPSFFNVSPGSQRFNIKNFSQHIVEAAPLLAAARVLIGHLKAQRAHSPLSELERMLFENFP